MHDGPPDPLRVAATVTNALAELGVRYSIGGSLASSVSGEPRSTLDVDTSRRWKNGMSVHVEVLQNEFYLDGRR